MVEQNFTFVGTNKQIVGNKYGHGLSTSLENLTGIVAHFTENFIALFYAGEVFLTISYTSPFRPTPGTNFTIIYYPFLLVFSYQNFYYDQFFQDSLHIFNYFHFFCCLDRHMVENLSGKHTTCGLRTIFVKNRYFCCLPLPVPPYLHLHLHSVIHIHTCTVTHKFIDLTH